MMAARNTYRSRLALTLLAATMLTPLDWAAAAPGDPIGDEFKVNSHTTDYQHWPGIASDADGDFVVTWMSNGQDGSNSGIHARRYAATGEPLGAEFLVNTSTANSQAYPAVAMDADGDFVVVWASYGQDGSESGIYGQRYNAAGAPLGGEFRVGSLAPFQVAPAVAMNDAGDFAVAWVGEDGSDYGIFARRYSDIGEAQGGDFLVNSTTFDRQVSPAVAMDADGDFVVTWASRSSSYLYSDYEVFARRYNTAGVAQGSEFLVNTDTYYSQEEPAVAMSENGDFVIAWEAWGDADGDGEAIFAQRYNAAGVPQGEEFLVNTTTTFAQWEPALAMDADGDFVVAWHSFGLDGSGWNAFAQRYTGTGVPQGGEFRVNATTTVGGWAPAVAMESDGDFVVAWAGDDGDALGVFGRRFEGGAAVPAVASDFNGDGMSDILWRNSNDGRTVVWQMNGFEKEAADIVGNVPGDWFVEDIGDFDGDGNSDILWRNAWTGTTSIWQMNGFVKQDSAVIGIVGGAWKVMGIGDFDGGGQADILWHNSSTGNTVIWQMDGFTKIATATIGAPSTDWRIKGVDDFNGDGKSDILWRNAKTGNTVIWQMDGFAKAAAASIGTVTGGWGIAGTGDFDPDGQADILWRNAGSGNTVIWRMSGFSKTAAATIGNVGSAWQVARVADYDGDGQADILWRNPGSGDTVIWQMSGFTKESSAVIGNVSGDWAVP